MIKILLASTILAFTLTEIVVAGTSFNNSLRQGDNPYINTIRDDSRQIYTGENYYNKNRRY